MPARSKTNLRDMHSTKTSRQESYFRGANWQLVANLENMELGIFDKVPNLHVRTKTGAQWPLRTSQGVSGMRIGANAGVKYVDGRCFLCEIWQ